MENIRKLLPEALGNEVFVLREEYEVRVTLEATYIKALDTLETLLHILEFPPETYIEHDFTATYADKYVQNFPALLPMLRAIKEKLKAAYKKA